MYRITDPKTTLNKPLRFFDEFFSTDSIEEAKKRFYPNLKNEFDQWRSFPVNIDEVNESFKVEYEHELNWDPETGPKFEGRARTYTLANVYSYRLCELKEYLKDPAINGWPC